MFANFLELQAEIVLFIKLNKSFLINEKIIVAQSVTISYFFTIKMIAIFTVRNHGKMSI